MVKVTCDTNIYISAILFGGVCEEILELARKKQIEIYISPAILSETLIVLKRKGSSRQQIVQVLAEINSLTSLITPQKKLSIIKEKEADNRILECAEEGRVDYIATGDAKHILPLKKYKDIKIVSPSDFLKLNWQK